MINWRTIAVGVLMVVPIAVIVAIGGWTLWQTGWMAKLWWMLPVCWAIAFLLARGMKPKLSDNQKASGLHWTPKDYEAASLVEARQQNVIEIPPENLTQWRFYLDSAQDLAQEITQHYHPKAKDPFTSLTVPELLAAASLAVADLENWANNYIPGSQMLTVAQWKLLASTSKWQKTASNLYWAGAILINPLNLSRFIASRYTFGPLTDVMQSNILTSFYIFFLRQVGYYAIEMNSGRLRGGSQQYREMMKRQQPGSDKTLEQMIGEMSQTNQPQTDIDSKIATTENIETVDVNIVMAGQVKAGKSSLVNSLLGRHQAKVGILPETKAVQRYVLPMPESNRQLSLLDTIGYQDAENRKKHIKENQAAYRNADMILLVMDARSPAREPEREFLQELAQWYARQNRLKPPPIIGVLTHIDGLSPVRVWEPPYNWDTPTHPKEHSIHEAVEYAMAILGEHVKTVVPVCSDSESNRVYGVREWLVPVIAASLNEAQAGSLLKTLHRELDKQKYKALLRQLKNTGLQILKSTLSHKKQ